MTNPDPTPPQDVIYVAGDRVVSDPMCKPFSMGRNLLCVHSRKHMYDDPSTTDAKQKQNRKTLVTMARLLNEGGKLIWIAPAGGRDRPKEVDGKDVWIPDNFDPSAVGLMVKMAESAKKPTHGKGGDVEWIYGWSTIPNPLPYSNPPLSIYV